MHVVTICPPAAEPHSGLRFDQNIFHRRHGNSLRFVGNSDRLRMRQFKVTDRTRRVYPEFAMTKEGLKEATLRYLEARFRIMPSGTASERLERCRQAAEKCVAPTKDLLQRGIQRYQAIAEGRFHELPSSLYFKTICNRFRGESDAKLLKRYEQQIAVWHSEIYTTERAPELTLSILYQSLRLGFDSPTVAGTLNISAPAVRQILARATKRAVQKPNYAGRTGRTKTSGPGPVVQ